MIVNCRVYEDGHRCPGEYTPETAARACHDNGAFVWLGLYEPTPEEFESVRREFGPPRVGRGGRDQSAPETQARTLRRFAVSGA